MKKINRKKSLAEVMIEPIRGCPSLAHLDLEISTYDLIGLRGICKKSSDKDLSKEICKIVHNYVKKWEEKDIVERINKLENSSRVPER